MLANWICRRKATPFDLVRFVNNIPDFIPTNCSMMARCQEQMGNLTQTMDWFPPRDGVYTTYPVNHPSVLIQRRILITLLSMVSHEQRAQFRKFGRGYVPQQRREQSRVTITTGQRQLGKPNTREMPRTFKETRFTRPARGEPSAKTSDTPKVMVAREIIKRKRPSEQVNSSVSDPQQWRKSRRVEETFASDTNNNIRMIQINLLAHKAFDSYFHLDKASILSTGSLQLSIEEFVEKPLHPPPEISVDLTGGVIVYCDPDTFPTVLPDT